ncbi:4'-phosphopantetheinyl transferase superfamily protein [Streptomyces sp. BR123]|uniref:4'-phosphopantetheinyl transferase family protein n=1 Tax=Streptomyces sp. BR123 TaxID=2749828 RepID=UPI002811955A|nr:4'-phosphopantetheinyl transferase superfamily protein [Streptomyces sp. BR123]
MSTHMNRLGEDVPRTGEPPAGTAVAVWSLDTTLGVVGGHRVEESLDLLDAGERDRSARFARPGDRRRYLASHVGLRLLLGGYLGLAPDKVTLVREECPCCGAPHGRPAVAGGGLHFSLSHSDDLAYLAFAAVPVGVDVERYPSAGAVADILGALHPAETAELTAAPEADRRMLLARLWARKEACLKGTGTGLAPGVAEPYVGSGPDPAEVAGWHLADLPAPDGYAAAVAARTPA